MPTLFVGLHAALAAVVSLFGLSLLADPCAGGGDLCLGGVVGTFALGVAALGGIGIVAWQIARRASPLFVWDCALLAVAGFVLLSGSPSAPALVQLGALLATLLSLGGAVLAARAVAVHRTERVLAVVALAGSTIVARESGIVVLVLGLVALGVGYRLSRVDTGEPA